MTNVKKAKYLLERIRKENKLERPVGLAWQLAICEILLGNNLEGLDLFKKALDAMAKQPITWFLSNQPNHLAEVLILSGENRYYNDVVEQLNNFRKKESGDSLVAHIAYGLVGLLLPELDWADRSSNFLINDSTDLEFRAIGYCIREVANGDIEKSHKYFSDIFEGHKQKAIHGSLRGTPEGWLSMPAMSLALISNMNGNKIVLENNYFSQTYIDLVLQQMSL